MSGSGCKQAGGTHIVSRLETKTRDTEISLRGVTSPPGQPSAANEEQPPPSQSSTANEGPQPPPASPSLAHEQRRWSPPAPQSTNPETQGGGRCRHRENGPDAAVPSSSKRQKVDHQVDSTGFNRRQSNQDRRPTAKAAEER